MKKSSEVILILEKAYQDLNEALFNNELEHAVITIKNGKQAKAYGWFTLAKKWVNSENQYHEINISSEYLDRPNEEILGTLIHEMVHLYNHQNNIQDCSRKGTYHNTKFRDKALAVGLTCEKTDKHGWSLTGLDEKGLEVVKSLNIPDITLSEAIIESPKASKKKSSIKYVCPCCGNIARTTKEMRILCGDCEMEMLEG